MTDRTELAEHLRRNSHSPAFRPITRDLFANAADVLEEDRDRAAAGVGLLDPPAPPAEGHDGVLNDQQEALYYRMVRHPFFGACYGEERSLSDAVMARLDTVNAALESLGAPVTTRADAVRNMLGGRGVVAGRVPTPVAANEYDTEEMGS